VKPAAFDYARASNLSEAAELLGDDTKFNRVLAGGQSLGPMLNLRLVQPDRLVDVTRIPEMKTIERDGDAVLIGACVTHAAIEDGGIPDTTNGMLESVAGGIACRAVRNRGTMGGSIAHADPAADWPTCLMALGAEVSIHGKSGARRLPLGDFLQGPFQTALDTGELLTGVRIPALSASARWGYYKFCRKAGEFAETMAAVLHDPERGIARAVIGATEARPTVIEEGVKVDASFNAKAAEDIVERAFPDADWYKRRLHAAALRRAVEEAVR
jgi:aerobic carbon-monoxide dehydrogenase medium subunit